MVLVCASCGLENSASNRFCEGCAASLAVVCPTCGGPASSGAKFCGQCACPSGLPAPGGEDKAIELALQEAELLAGAQ